MESPKVGLSRDRRAELVGEREIGGGEEWRYLDEGEKSFTTRGHTRSVNSWLNSFSCKGGKQSYLCTPINYSHLCMYNSLKKQQQTTTCTCPSN